MFVFALCVCFCISYSERADGGFLETHVFRFFFGVFERLMCEVEFFWEVCLEEGTSVSLA